MPLRAATDRDFKEQSISFPHITAPGKTLTFQNADLSEWGNWFFFKFRWGGGRELCGLVV